MASAVLRIEGADGALHLDLVRDDIAAHAAVDAADRDDGRAPRDIQVAAGNALDRGGNFRGHVDRIHPEPG